jgi:hypothetical protein
MTLTGLNKNLVILELKERFEFLIDSMESAIKRVVNDNNSDFSKKADEVRDDIVTIISNNTIGESIAELFDVYNLVGETARIRYLLSKELFSLVSDKTLIESNVDLKEAISIFDLTVQINNIFLAYLNAIDISFSNLQDLNAVIEDLEAECNKIIIDADLDSNARVSLVDTRTGSMSIFSSLDLKSLTTFNTAITSSRALSYRLYGTTENSDQIVDLNKANNTAFIEGDVTILSTD